MATTADLLSSTLFNHSSTMFNRPFNDKAMWHPALEGWSNDMSSEPVFQQDVQGQVVQLRNWPDDDIRLYAWTIISTTLSIFTAVLSFSGVRATWQRLNAFFLCSTPA